VRIILATLFLISPIVSLAERSDLYGSWEGGDRASKSIYGTLIITETEIAWEDCVVEYELKEEEPGIVYWTSYAGIEFKTGEEETYLLVKKKSNCDISESGFRFTFTIKSKNYLDLIEYDGNGRMLGKMHFHRR